MAFGFRDDQFKKGYRDMTDEDCVSMVAESIRNILGVCPNEPFRQKCFEILQISNSDDAGPILERELSKRIRIPIPEDHKTLEEILMEKRLSQYENSQRSKKSKSYEVPELQEMSVSLIQNSQEGPTSILPTPPRQPGPSCLMLPTSSSQFSSLRQASPQRATSTSMIRTSPASPRPSTSSQVFFRSSSSMRQTTKELSSSLSPIKGMSVSIFQNTQGISSLSESSQEEETFASTFQNTQETSAFMFQGTQETSASIFQNSQETNLSAPVSQNNRSQTLSIMPMAAKNAAVEESRSQAVSQKTTRTHSRSQEMSQGWVCLDSQSTKSQERSQAQASQASQGWVSTSIRSQEMSQGWVCLDSQSTRSHGGIDSMQKDTKSQEATTPSILTQ